MDEDHESLSEISGNLCNLQKSIDVLEACVAFDPQRSLGVFVDCLFLEKLSERSEY